MDRYEGNLLFRRFKKDVKHVMLREPGYLEYTTLGGQRVKKALELCNVSHIDGNVRMEIPLAIPGFWECMKQLKADTEEIFPRYPRRKIEVRYITLRNDIAKSVFQYVNNWMKKSLWNDCTLRVMRDETTITVVDNEPFAVYLKKIKSEQHKHPLAKRPKAKKRVRVDGVYCYEICSAPCSEMHFPNRRCYTDEVG